MDLDPVFNPIEQTWMQVERFLAASPGLAAAGLAVAAGMLVAVFLASLLSLGGVIAAARRSAAVAAVKGSRELGVRVLAVDAAPGRRNTAAKLLRAATETHLGDFMFGGPFRVIRFPGGCEDEAAARSLLERTGADLIVWTSAGRHGAQRAHMLARRANSFEPHRPGAAFALPKDRSGWTPAVSRALAYAAAKQFRPALGRPQDFRAERLKPVVETLLAILADAPKVDPRLLAEMADDAAAGALQLAIAGEEGWLERATDITLSTLNAVNRSVAPDRWIAAKIAMGRALRVKAERRFDPVVLRESIAHLTEALDALRAEPRFKLAESAAQSIGEAQKLLGARRKFSISGGSI